MKTVRLGQEVKRFKFAVLMYSLKMKYDIKFYNSSANRLAVWCTKHEKKNVVGECTVLSKKAGTS